MIAEKCGRCGEPIIDEESLFCGDCDHCLMAAAELRDVNLAIKILQRFFSPSQQEQIVRAIWWNREGRG